MSFEKKKVVPGVSKTSSLWQKVPCPKGFVLVKNVSSCLNEPTNKCFFYKVIPPSPNLQTRLFVRATRGVLKFQDATGAISVKPLAGGGVLLLETVG